ncbi:uncharacterized protein Dmul_30870 [Desulfococcus multivorans]|nr:uncharacterized protein Dmul_30870 [Desulfococcus multivorans]
MPDIPPRAYLRGEPLRHFFIAFVRGLIISVQYRRLPRTALPVSGVVSFFRVPSKATPSGRAGRLQSTFWVNYFSG